MMTPLLLAFLSFQQVSTQQLEQRTEQIQQQVRQVEREIEGVRSSVDQMRSTLRDDLRPVCSAHAKWQQAIAPRVPDAQSPVIVSLVSMVSAPRDACLSAELRITANYHDDSGRFVCSGSLSLSQAEIVQNTYFEFRPFLMDYFAKWRDAATWEQSNFHRLICYDYEGIEVRDPAARGVMLKLFVTVLPRRGGLATDELQIAIPRPPPQQGLTPRFR